MPLDTQLLEEATRDVTTLGTDPTNIGLRSQILKKQVKLTASQLGVTEAQAGKVVKSYTSAYAYSKGIDPKELYDALTADEQRIIDYAADDPKLYGVDLVTAQKIASYFGIGSGVLLAASITLFVVALFTLGPEIAATFASSGVVATIASVTGSPLVATGGFLFLLSQFLGHLSTTIPMLTKQMIDNGSIGPGLRIKALTDAEIAKRNAGLPSALPAGASGSSTGSGKSFVRLPVTRITMSKQKKPTLLLGTLFSAVVANAATFSRVVDDQITDANDLKADALANLNRWLASLPGRLIYSIGVQNNPKDENAVVRTGTWVVMQLSIKGVTGIPVVVDNILLGPVAPTVYMPKTTDMQTVQVELPKLLTGEEIAQLQFPNDGLQIVDKTGNVVPLNLPASSPAPSTDVAAAAAGVPGLAGYLADQAAAAAAEQSGAPAPVAPAAATPAPNFSSATQGPIYVPPPAPVATPAPTPAPVAAPAGLFPGAENGGTMRVYGPDVQKAINAGYTVVGSIQDAGSVWPSALITKPAAPAPNTSTASGPVYTPPPSTTAALPANFTRSYSPTLTIHVNVTKLYVRTAPTSSAPLAPPDHLQMGSIFDAAGATVGENVSGENRWWITREGWFIWAGGTVEKPN